MPVVSAVSVNEMIEANVNPDTGLATDYLNLFNEGTMLFEMAFDMPDMVRGAHDLATPDLYRAFPSVGV